MPHPQILTSHLLYSKVLRGKMLHNNFTFSVKNDGGNSSQDLELKVRNIGKGQSNGKTFWIKSTT